MSNEHGSAGFGRYDERQVAVRGRAYKWGFITLITSLLVYIYGIVSWSWMEPMVGCAMCISLGIGVFLGISVYGGAYHWMSTENTKGFYMLWLLTGAINLARFAADKPLISDGKLSLQVFHLETVIIFFAIAAADIAARIRDKRREEE